MKCYFYDFFFFLWVEISKDTPVSSLISRQIWSLLFKIFKPQSELKWKNQLHARSAEHLVPFWPLENWLFNRDLFSSQFVEPSAGVQPTSSEEQEVVIFHCFLFFNWVETSRHQQTYLKSYNEKCPPKYLDIFPLQFSCRLYVTIVNLTQLSKEVNQKTNITLNSVHLLQSFTQCVFFGLSQQDWEPK